MKWIAKLRTSLLWNFLNFVSIKVLTFRSHSSRLSSTHCTHGSQHNFGAKHFRNWIIEFQILKRLKIDFPQFNWQTNSLIEIDNVVNGKKRNRKTFDEIFMQLVLPGVNRHNLVTRRNFISIFLTLKVSFWRRRCEGRSFTSYQRFHVKNSINCSDKFWVTFFGVCAGRTEEEKTFPYV